MFLKRSGQPDREWLKHLQWFRDLLEADQFLKNKSDFFMRQPVFRHGSP